MYQSDNAKVENHSSDSHSSYFDEHLHSIAYSMKEYDCSASIF